MLGQPKVEEIIMKRSLIAAAAALCLMAVGAIAQVNSSIGGTVEDASKASIPLG